MSQHVDCLRLFLGADRAHKLERVRQLADQLQISPLDFHSIHAAQMTTPEILSLIRQHPMQSPRRLVVIDEAHRLEAACLEALSQQWEQFQQTACVVLLVEADIDDEPAWEGLRRRASVEDFGGEASRTPDHFVWLNAIAQRNIPAALQGLHEQLGSGKEELELLGLMVWQVQRWLTLAHLLEAGASRAQIEAATGWKPWLVARLMDEVRGRSVESLHDSLERCWKLDVDAKRGRAPRLTTALEQVVVSLCGPLPPATSPIASSGGK